MKLKRSKKWYAKKIPLEEGEVGAGSLTLQKKLTWADKVRLAIDTNSELRERIRIFENWKSMVKRDPYKYRITHFARSFTFEENTRGAKNSWTGIFNKVEKTNDYFNVIWWYIKDL